MEIKTSAEKKKRGLRTPDAFIIIFAILVLAALSTYTIPSGTFDRVDKDGRSIVVEGTYSSTEAEPIGIMDVFTAIQQGLIQSADLIFMVLIIGGTVALFESTGAINSGIHSLINKAKGRKYPLVILFIVIFAIMDVFGVSGNSIIAFIPIGIILAKALKLDPIVGVAMIYLGQYAGVATGTFDPVITGLAQSIAELPLLSGAGLRFAAFISLLVVTIVYICLYVKRITADPSKSLVGIYEGDNSEEASVQGAFTGRHKLILLTFLLFIALFLYGVYNLDWSINELAAVFLMMGIAVAIVGRISPNEFVRIFISGAQGMVYGALVIGLARSVVVILEQGAVLDTIVNFAFEPLSSLPAMLGAQAIYLFNLAFNLLITSGTGQASITMPFIVPLVDMLGITRQTGVLAFKLGDGITNIITPTSGVLMAVLAVGKVPYVKWFKFIFPLVLIWSIIGFLFIAIAVMIDYGPF